MGRIRPQRSDENSDEAVALRYRAKVTFEEQRSSRLRGRRVAGKLLQMLDLMYRPSTTHTMLAALVIMTSQAVAGSRSDEKSVTDSKTAEVVADVFGATKPSRELSEDSALEEEQSSHFLPSDSQSTLSNRGKTIDLPAGFLPTELPAAGSSNPLFTSDARDTYYDSNPFFKKPRPDAVDPDSRDTTDGTLPFWSGAQANEQTNYGDGDEVKVDFAAANTTPTNVLIPLPMAAWSALSVMGGAGLVRGFRKIRQQLH